jgi:hypothetical protein
MVGATNIGEYAREVMGRIANDMESQLLFCSALLDLQAASVGTKDLLIDLSTAGGASEETMPAVSSSNSRRQEWGGGNVLKEVKPLKEVKRMIWKDGLDEDMYQGGGGEKPTGSAALKLCSRKKMRVLRQVAKSNARRRRLQQASTGRGHGGGSGTT